MSISWSICKQSSHAMECYSSMERNGGFTLQHAHPRGHYATQKESYKVTAAIQLHAYEMFTTGKPRKSYIKATSVGPGTREYSIQCTAEGEAPQGQASCRLVGKTVAWMRVRLRIGPSPERLGQAGIMESRVHVWYRQDWVKYRSGVMGNAQARWWVCLSDWLKRPGAGWTDGLKFRIVFAFWLLWIMLLL